MIYMIMNIRKYMVEAAAIETPKDEVYKYLIKQLKVLLLGMSMLRNTDLHIVQVSQHLAQTVKIGEKFLQKFELLEDFKMATE